MAISVSSRPGTSFDSQTRVVDLTDSTIKANSIHFDTIDDVQNKPFLWDYNLLCAQNVSFY